MNGFKFKIKGTEHEISYISIFFAIVGLVCVVLLAFGLITMLDIKKAIKEGKEIFD